MVGALPDVRRCSVMTSNIIRAYGSSNTLAQRMLGDGGHAFFGRHQRQQHVLDTVQRVLCHLALTSISSSA
jgi:hypothetical protein